MWIGTDIGDFFYRWIGTDIGGFIYRWIGTDMWLYLHLYLSETGNIKQQLMNNLLVDSKSHTEHYEIPHLWLT